MCNDIYSFIPMHGYYVNMYCDIYGSYIHTHPRTCIRTYTQTSAIEITKWAVYTNALNFCLRTWSAPCNV